MAKHEIIAQVIEDLDAIDYYDRVMYEAGLCTREVQSNMLLQDKLLAQLERLDADAYICYITGDDAVLEKYYRKPKEVTA
jgi:hypothetical protein